MEQSRPGGRSGPAASYRRGPTQLLTTLPLSLLDSYREIALVLLVVYGALILASVALVVSSSLLFYPTLVAYIAREFEVLLLFATVMLFAAARSERHWLVGAWT